MSIHHQDRADLNADRGHELAGAAVTLVVAAALAPPGAAAAPWQPLRPTRPPGMLRPGGTAGVQIVVANLRLARPIRAPSRPLSSAMVVVPTHERSDGGSPPWRSSRR